jgi:DNA-binding FadR family transcriptional regulator
MTDRIAVHGDGRQEPSGRPARKAVGQLRGLHGQTVETIGSRIVGGSYPPGSQLPPPEELERELGISKTVLREAIRVLASKGLVLSRQKRGTMVQPRSSWNLLDADLLRWQGGRLDERYLDDLAEVRYIVEPAAARLAAERRTDGDLEQLRAALRAMADADGDAEAVIEADLAFHRSLLYAAHNELLSRMEIIIEAGLRARDLLVHHQPHWPDSVPVHDAIVAALKAGDSAAAETAVLALLDQASTDVSRAGTGNPGSRTPA